MDSRNQPFIAFDSSKLFLSLSRNDGICLMIYLQPSFVHLSPAFFRKHLGVLSTALVTSAVGFQFTYFFILYFENRFWNLNLSQHFAGKMFFFIATIPLFFSHKTKHCKSFFNAFFSTDNFINTTKYLKSITIAGRMADTGFAPPRSLGLEPKQKAIIEKLHGS